MSTHTIDTDETTTIAQIKTQMKQWVAARNWEKYHLPKNLASSVSIEAGVLLEMFQWLTPDDVIAKSKDPAFRLAVSEEMVDVLMYLISLANVMEIDLAESVVHKMAKNEKKYPAEKFQGHYERPI